jgi:3-methyl-2-oxobutanoate hydroxymethyltransferase
MPDTPKRKFTLADLRAARETGAKVAILTCYDYTTARVMTEAGVPAILVGDSAANVILGHPTTLPVTLDFMIEITAAVRRGAPYSLVVADMPFGSYQSSVAQGVKNVARMVQLSGCDCVKLEAGKSQIRLISRLADSGVAVLAHLGLRPQSIGLLGDYKARGRTAVEAQSIVELAMRFDDAGAAALLLEAVPGEVGAAVVAAVKIPVIGCGAGPACHGHVVVTQDALNLTPHRPKFVPEIGDLAAPMKQMFALYVKNIVGGEYPAVRHAYEMPPDEKAQFEKHITQAQKLSR